jgi:hypothetical protein
MNPEFQFRMLKDEEVASVRSGLEAECAIVRIGKLSKHCRNFSESSNGSEIIKIIMHYRKCNI